MGPVVPANGDVRITLDHSSKIYEYIHNNFINIEKMDNNPKTKKKNPLLWIIAIPIVLILCTGMTIATAVIVYNNSNRISIGTANKSYTTDSLIYPSTTYDYSDEGSYAGASEEYATMESADYSDTTTTWGEKIIKSGSLSLVVNDLDAAQADIETIVDSKQGYIVYLYDYDTTGGDRIISITFKVPQENFDATYEEVKGIADEVVSASIDANDVTQEYTDLQSRLTNLKASESQYLTIMSRATDIEDILAVQNELTNVREEIEVIQGQINYYDSYTDYSTITVTLSLSPENIEIPEEKWRPWAVVVEAWEAFLEVLKWLFKVLIWFLVFSPCVLVPALIIIVVRKARKKKAKLNR